MKASTRIKNYVLGHDPEDWPVVAQASAGARIPGRVHFPTLEALVYFCEAVERECGGKAVLRIGSRNAPPTDVETVDELFRLTSGPLYLLSIQTPAGQLLIDNRTRRRTSTSLNPTVGVDGQADPTLALLAQRYLVQVPLWRRWKRTPVATDIPASERRDNHWKLTVGIVSSTLGGVLGFVGGLISGGLSGPH